MPNIFNKSTLSGVYRDDYNENDNYHQILFRSGRALQARELTQLQTLIYEEMGRFGRNVFKEGAAVSSAGSAIDADYHYVQIVTTSGGSFSDIPVGSVFTNTNGVKARVLEVKPTAGDFTINTLYIQYINSGNSAVGSSPTTFAASDVLTQSGGSFSLTVASSPATGSTSVVGKGVRFSVDGGDFFVLGRFVHANAQSIILSAYSESIDAEVGFKVIQEVITVNDTTALYDNTGSSPNTAAPGADRYRIYLELIDKADLAADDTFVSLATIENSKIVEEIRPTDGFNEINNLLALRTNEESGDYTVNPFTINVDSSSQTELAMTISEGLAYVNGYRVENPSPIELIVPRSQATELVDNETIPALYGNYVILEEAKQIPDLTYASVNIYSDSPTFSNQIGTCRIRGMETVGGKLRLYLFDIDINAGSSFENAWYIGTNTQYFKIEGGGPADQNTAVLYETLDNDLLFPTPRPRASSLSDVVLVRQQYFTPAAAGSNQITITTADGTFTDDTLWIVVNTDPAGAGGTAFTPSSVTGTGTGTAVISDGGVNIQTGQTYVVLAYVQVTSPTAATKTLVDENSLTLFPGGITGVSGEYDLTVPDIYEIEIIRDTDASGVDVTERFILDDGQRDNFYADSKLILKPEYSDQDPGTIYVEWKRFERGVGDFYAGQSYGSIPYSSVPTHTLKNGEKVSLRNYLDFRPDKNNGTFSNFKYLPRRGSSITADTTYYLPRADKLIVTQEGDFQILMGQQSRDPQFKKTPENSLELYQILMGANTADEEDLQIKPIEHKRYTMADIAALDDKIEDLRQYTELSLAELRAYHEPSLDSAGDERPESGIVVDPIEDQTGADTGNDDYAASIDPENNLIRPAIDENNIRLVMENTLSSGVVKKGDNVYLQYDSATWQDQPLASRSVNPNPFGLVDNVGVLKLSPSTDEWRDVVQDAEKAVKGSSKLDKKQAFLWNNWQWNWKGRNSEDIWISDPDTFGRRGMKFRDEIDKRDVYRSNSSIQRNAAGYVRRVVRRDSLRRVVGNRVIDVALIPWMRSRKVYFKAQGLKPNTRFTPFFDGVNVSDWCKSETFVAWSDRTDDVGNKFTYNTLTQHPDGSSNLISDANGEVSGSFWIPNLKPTYYVWKKGVGRKLKRSYLRFRAGVREFKLLDIDTNNWAQAESKAFAYYSVVGAVNTKNRHVLNTRGIGYRWPLGLGYAGFPSAYNPAELKQVLDQTEAGVVNIVNPLLAGKYGPDTSSAVQVNLGTLDANGTMSQVLSDYINVNNKQFAGNIVAPTNLPQNPLSQTFTVDNQFGIVLTKVSLFFRSIPSTADGQGVSVHIRPVVDGKPSVSEIVPDSHVFLKASEITPVTGDPTLSAIQEEPTEFIFDEPIFLQPHTEYAVVVTSNSTEYSLWSAKTLDYVAGSEERRITTQPGPGTLFLPQNGVNWLEAKDQDLMMKLTRAVFNVGGGSLILRNADLPAKLLDTNPLRFTSGSGKVYVKSECHGLLPGDTVILDSAQDVSNIVADTSLNLISHTVDSADIHGFTFTMPGAVTCNDDITAGGANVLTTKNVLFDVANPTIENIIPNFTSVDFSAKFITGVRSDSDVANRFKPNNESGAMSDAKYERITPEQNLEFDYPRAIYNSSVTDTGPGASQLGGSDPASKYSAYLKVDFKTSNDYVSPVVDLQRASLTLAGQCIDNPLVNTQVYPVDETEPQGGSTGSKHITPPVTLEIPAVTLDIRSEQSLPGGCVVDCYYRTGTADQDLSEQNWVRAYPTENIPGTDRGVFTPVQYLPGGKNGTLSPFTQSQVKMVMRGGLDGPIIKRLNIKAISA